MGQGLRERHHSWLCSLDGRDVVAPTGEHVAGHRSGRDLHIHLPREI